MPEAETIPLYYDSQDQCSGALGIPKEILKRAKKDGCPAFKATRVYVKPLIEWLATAGQNLEMGKEEAQTFESIERGKKLRLERLQLEKELVALPEVQRLMVETFQPIRDLMAQLPAQMGARCNPADPNHAISALSEWLKLALPQIRESWPMPPQNHETEATGQN